MNNNTRFAPGRSLDIVCLGRLAVDFYAQQIGARLEDVASFAKYLGGSSANTAFGCARLGLRAALISRIGDDAMGHFLVETLTKEGCDVSHIGVDPQRLTEKELEVIARHAQTHHPCGFFRLGDTSRQAHYRKQYQDQKSMLLHTLVAAIGPHSRMMKHEMRLCTLIVCGEEQVWRGSNSWKINQNSAHY